MTAGKIFDYLNKIAPFEYQDDWDNAGFLIGDKEAKVTKALLALDATCELITEAEKMGVQLIITHHPALFHAQKSFLAGNIGFEAAKNNISIISAHTNYDAAVGGVNDILSSFIGLNNVSDLFAKDEKQAMMRQGECEPQKASQFAELLYEKLGKPVRYTCPDKIIRKVAVCGGAGCMFFSKIIEGGFDAFVTGDADHHEFLDAAAADIALFAAGHFETEAPAVSTLADMLKAEFKDVEFIMSEQASPVFHKTM